MTNEQILNSLIAFLESNDITVKSDRGNFKGGIVRCYDELYLYLNRKWDTDAKIKLILSEIKQMDLNLDILEDEIKTLLN